MLLRTPYPTPPLDMNILSGAFFFLSIISLLKLKLLVHVRLSLFSASFWESVLMNAFKIGRIILIIVFFAFLCKICHCDSQLESSNDNLTLAAKIKDVEELRFLKGTTATFDCPLTLQSGNGKGKDNFSQESENDPAYLMKALKVVFFYKGTDSPSPLASYDNRDIEEIRKVHLNEEMTGQSAGRFRVYVHYLSKRALLAIDKVVENDEGTYHCRVDYRWSGTTRKKFRMELIGLFISALSQPGDFLIMHLLLLPLSLSLSFSLSFSLSLFLLSLVPPEQMVIQDLTNSAKVITINNKNGIIGPYAEESSYVALACVVTGGETTKPEPYVRWYEGSILLDDQLDYMESEHRLRDEESEEEEKEDDQLEAGSLVEIRRNDDGHRAQRRRHSLKRRYYAEIISFVYRHGLVNCTNRLVVKEKLTRKDYRRQFKCVAGNTDRVPPIEREVTLDMFLRPVSVKIIVGSADAFVAGHNAGLVCRSWGSKPFAQLAWYKNGVHITDQIQGHFDARTNDSISTMRFRPTLHDDNAEFECHATNIALPEEIGTVRDSIRIRVQHIPQLKVVPSYSLVEANKSSDSQRLLIEGTRLQLHCIIRAHPPLNSSLIWLLNDQEVNANRCEHLNCTINGPLLTINSLNASLHNGKINCYGENAIGPNLSTTFSLVVSYAPRCSLAHPQATEVYRAAIGETVLINCQVVAHPTSSLYYDWYVNATSREMDVGNGNVAAAMFRYSKQRTLVFTPKNRFDYGNFSCAAHNTVGHMTGGQLCKYTLLPNSKPDPVSWCAAEQQQQQQVAGPTQNDLEQSEEQSEPLVPFTLTCKFPYNGGLERTLCSAEVTRLNDSVLLWAGESTAPARLLPDGLTYQCVIRSPEGVMAEQGVQYRFSVTPVNSVGPAVKPFTFTSSFSSPPPPPPPPPLEKVVKKDTGGDLVVKQWDQANSVTSSASAVNSRGSSQVNRIVMAFHSMEQSGQKVASFLLQNVVTFPAAAIMALLVGAYFLALFSFQAARLRYARHVIYNQFTVYCFGCGKKVSGTKRKITQGAGCSVQAPVVVAPIRTVSAVVQTLPPISTSTSTSMSPNSAEAVVVLSRAQQYSAQMSRAHLLSNGRDSMASPEFGWIDPFEDCEEYHIQDEQELQAEQQWAMKYLLKMSNKKEYRRQKKAAIAAAAAAAAQAALSTDPNAENEANSAEKKEEDKRSLLPSCSVESKRPL
ncbi:hypothetical protein TYRP_012249 [Tyrophagus putrescentiae]|nr:hypothetical protein TYRP_012249 [Tyrophagus putrescentiae]